MRKRSWRRRLAFAALTTTAGTVFAGLTAETIGQVYGSRHPAWDVLAWQADPDLGWRLVPDLEFTWAGQPPAWYAREFEVRVRVNEHGFRDRPRAVAKPAGALRVALLGDSFLEGIQVPLEETCAQRLESRLQARNPAAEVLNLGISNHGIGQSLLVYEHVARRFSPDWVVVLANELVFKRTVLPGDAGAFAETVGTSLEVRPWFSADGQTLVRHPARDHAALVEVQQELLAGLGGERSRRRPRGWFLPGRLRDGFASLAYMLEPVSYLDRPTTTPEEWFVNALVLAELGREARAAKTRVAVVDTCLHLHLGAGAISDALRALCDQEGLVWIDASMPLFAADRRGTATRWTRDAHWTAAGHDVVAEAIDVALRAHGT